MVSGRVLAVSEPRSCAICAASMEGKAPTYKTCGHPRCVREYRAYSKRRASHGIVKSTRRLPDWTPPDIMAPEVRGRMRVTDAWDRLADLPEWDRIAKTAAQAGETVAVTLSVLRAEGRIR
jgi:hypothetical protein